MNRIHQNILTVFLLLSIISILNVKGQYTLRVDLSNTIRPVTHCASGSLYGVTEDLPGNIAAQVEPLNPYCFVQPARAGWDRQRPFGAAIPVSQRLASTTGVVTIRLADLCPGWPYNWPGQSTWLSDVSSVINDKRASGRSNYYGYEIWNERHGTWRSENGDWYTRLWKPTYDMIRAHDPGAEIIGPSDSYYLRSRIEEFLRFCLSNNCLPDIISWHELSGSTYITSHINDYRALERSLGISPRKISINEYCHPTHEYEGCPGTSAPFIAKFERNMVHSAAISWWFVNLPGRLGSLLTSNNERGGGWHFYKWYGDMTGNMVNVIPPNDNSDGVDGFACLDMNARYASICLGGNSIGNVDVVVSGIPASFGTNVNAKIEYIPWSGKDNPVSGPSTVSNTNYAVSNGAITVPVNVTSQFYGYRVYITPGSGGGETSIWLEAECGTVGSLWETTSDGNASNDEYVTVQSGNNSTDNAPTSTSGQITYNFNVGESGLYNIWARVIAPSPTDDSFWIRIDGGSWFLWNNITSSSSWTWDDAQLFDLSAGNHTLTVAYREDGTLLDKILISNTGITPAGEGSAANNCGGSCEPSAIVPYISMNDESWQQAGSVTIDPGDKLILGPQPTEGIYSWNGCGTSGSNREQTIYPTNSCTAIATYTNACGAQSTYSFNINVDGGAGSNIVWLEAECGTVGSLWDVSSDGNASNNEYVSIQSGNNSTGSAPGSASGQLSYTFNLSENGTYTLWARVIAPSPNDDSYWVQMDGGSWQMWNNIAPASTTWTWDDVDSYSLSAGTHTLNIGYREDGTQLDKLYLSNTGGTPSGEGDAGNNCGSGNYSITVRALGVDGSEQITLTVGGTAVQSWTLGTGMSDYSATTSLSGPIAIEFTNDDGTVRDVQIDYISVEGTVWQAEDQSINTGVWQDGSCGGSNSEWLHCGGYIQFGSFKAAGSNSLTSTDKINPAELVLYPNPASDKLFMIVPEAGEEKAEVSIYSLAGVLISSNKIHAADAMIDLSDFSAGYYLVKVGVGQRLYTAKFLKN